MQTLSKEQLKYLLTFPILVLSYECCQHLLSISKENQVYQDKYKLPHNIEIESFAEGRKQKTNERERIER